MHSNDFETILRQIAQVSQRTPEELRQQMQQVLDSALADPDPAVQAMWDSIPRKGAAPTLDEFMDHLINQNLLLPE